MRVTDSHLQPSRVTSTVMKMFNTTYAAVSFALATGLFVGFVGGNMFAQSEIEWREWIGATSGWAAAIVAGFTIFVLWRQIQVTQETAHKQENEALQLFETEVADVLERINKVWKHLEDIDQYEGQLLDLDKWVQTIKFEMARLEKRVERMELNRYITLMLPMNQKKCSAILSTILYSTETITHVTFDDDSGITEHETFREEYLESLKFRFNLVAERVRENSPELVRIFENRNMAPVTTEEKFSFATFKLQGILPDNYANPY